MTINNQSYRAFKYHVKVKSYLLAAAWCYENIGDLGDQWQLFGWNDFGFRNEVDVMLFALHWGWE